MFGTQIHALPDHKYPSKKKKNRKHGIYIQYPLSHTASTAITQQLIAI